MFNKISFIQGKNSLFRKNYLISGAFSVRKPCVVSNTKIVKVKTKQSPRMLSNLKQQNSRITNRKVNLLTKNNTISCNSEMNMGLSVMPSLLFDNLIVKKITKFNINAAWLQWLFKIDKLYLNNKPRQYFKLKQSINSESDHLLFKINSNKFIVPNVSRRNVPLISTTLANQIRQCSTISSDETRRRSPNTSSVAENVQTLPKNVLHNVYEVVAQELNDREFKLQPTFNIIKEKKNTSSWCCTYNIKWPEPIKFVSVAKTKKEASHKAALSALLWLKNKGRITKDGHPVIVEREEIKEITKRNIPNLKLGSDVKDELQTITDMYEKLFVPLLSRNLDQEKEDHELNELNNLNEPSDVNLGSLLNQKVFHEDKYLTKEKIQLPISYYKQDFINLLRDNGVVIVKGEPGCGKSTRIPQFVLESWAQEGLSEGEPCRIVVTQPRRIAAISLATRVSNERDERCGHIVGYQVRLKSNFNPTTGRILYCTTGILLRLLQSDLSLSNFTYVILDEAHERDVNTDLLMNLMRNSLQRNPKLKLIVMSATFDTDMFKNYFENAAVMHIPGFTHPVRSYFLDDLKELNLIKSREMCKNESPSVVHEDVVKLIEHIHKTKDEGAILCFLPGWEDISKIEKLIPTSNDLSVMCLHSRLQDSDQWKIFSKPPPGVRKIILSTNIAETSVTIDDVVYVIDTGIHKESRFDTDRGVSCIDNYWISKASMTQRKGRAGRVQPGESFHLYTKSKYESLPQYTAPEILKTSLTKIVLNSKVYSNNMNALEFMSHLPSPPEENSTKRAVQELKDLELLDDNENLTSLGKTLANFQMEPKLAKVLVNAVVYKCVTPVVDIVTLFSADTELFGNSLLDKDAVKRVKSKCSQYSDHLAMMRLFESWLVLMQDQNEEAAQKYCYNASLTHHKLVTISKLRKIHFDYLYNGLRDSLPIADDYSDNDELVKAVLLSGVGSLLKHRDWDIIKNRYKKKNIFLTNTNQKATVSSESVNYKKSLFPSDYFVYFNELRSNIRRTTVIRECSMISPLAALLFAPKELIIKEDADDEDRVMIKLKNTQVDFLCDKEEAIAISKCKEALNSAYQYYIFQLTEGGEYNVNVNKIWDKVLKRVDNILSKQNIK